MAFFYPSDLVNTKTTIPLRVDEERWIYTFTSIQYVLMVSSLNIKFIYIYIYLYNNKINAHVYIFIQ